MCTDCLAKQCAEGESASNCTFCPAELYQNTVGSTSCKLCAAGIYQAAAEQTKCKVCDVVNVSHLYEYLAVTETHVTNDFALAGATAYCVCGTGRSNSDASSSTVCEDHRNMRRRQLHQRPRQQHPEPKVRSVRG